jgi:hypothetical protein
MKILFLSFLMIVLFIIPCQNLYSQDDVTVIVPTTEAGENLDLQAVMELFKEAETIEDFEKALNDSSNEVNNLDLNEDGEVDYIRIVEYVEGDAHVLVLQVPLAENEYQDVATINIEKNNEDWVLQAVGDPDLYGEDYYVEPEPEVEVQTTTVVVVMFGVGYSPWISPWHWHYYPHWWRPWRPHPISVYRSRVVRHHRAHFRHTRHRSTLRSHNTYKSHRKTSSFAKQKTKKNTYHTQPTKKKQDPKKKQTTTKKQTQQKKTTAAT